MKYSVMELKKLCPYGFEEVTRQEFHTIIKRVNGHPQVAECDYVNWSLFHWNSFHTRKTIGVTIQPRVDLSNYNKRVGGHRYYVAAAYKGT